MELLDVMKKRFSVRKYKEQQVEPEKLAKILEAAHVAPTATNAQPVRLIVVQSEEGRAKLDKAARLYGALPDNLEPINLLALGYADTEEKGSDRHKTERISLDELVTYK